MSELNEKELCECELEEAAGGAARARSILVGSSYTTYVKTGYLALRNYPSYDSKNEIGPLWNGSTVVVTEYSGGTYAVVAVNYAAKGAWGPDVSGRVGYVNVNYLR